MLVLSTVFLTNTLFGGRLLTPVNCLCDFYLIFLNTVNLECVSSNHFTYCSF